MSKIFVLVLMALTQNAFAIECSDFFKSQNRFLQTELESILLNDLALARIHNIRRENQNSETQPKGTVTVEIQRAIREIVKIPEKGVQNEKEKIVFDMGLFC